MRSPPFSLTPHFSGGTLPFLSHFFLEERRKCFSENILDPPPKPAPINKLLTQLDHCAGHWHHPHGHPLALNGLLIKRLLFVLSICSLPELREHRRFQEWKTCPFLCSVHSGLLLNHLQYLQVQLMAIKKGCIEINSSFQAGKGY